MSDKHFLETLHEQLIIKCVAAKFSGDKKKKKSVAALIQLLFFIEVEASQ